MLVFRDFGWGTHKMWVSPQRLNQWRFGETGEGNLDPFLDKHQKPQVYHHQRLLWFCHPIVLINSCAAEKPTRLEPTWIHHGCRGISKSNAALDWVRYIVQYCFWLKHISSSFWWRDTMSLGVFWKYFSSLRSKENIGMYSLVLLYFLVDH